MKTTIENALPVEYNRVLALRGVMLEQDLINDFMKVPVHSFSKYLGLKKNREDNGTSLVLRDEKGNLIHYKEHYGRISYSANNKEFTGSVAGEKTSNNVSLKGSSEEEVKKAFKDYIDEMMNTGKNKKS